MHLSDKVALITGSGVRLGRAMALALAEQGCDVIVHYHQSDDEANEVVARIRQMGRRAVALSADLRDAGRAGELIERGAQALGQVDILINSASLFERGTLDETTEALWDHHLAVNLKAPFFLCQAFARQIGERRGHIINMVDWRAARPGTAYIAYYMSKTGLLALTESLAQALGPNVQVNAIAPGAILPPPGDDGSYFRKLAQRVPLKRTGSPEEIVKGVLYLLDSDFVTGETLFITGGEHL
jgi:pteridine reductase